MSKPRKNENTGNVPVAIKTMFYTEGNPAALLVENRLGKRRQSVMDFPSAEAALGWCRAHGSNLIYTPVNISNQ